MQISVAHGVEVGVGVMVLVDSCFRVGVAFTRLMGDAVRVSAAMDIGEAIGSPFVEELVESVSSVGLLVISWLVSEGALPIEQPEASNDSSTKTNSDKEISGLDLEKQLIKPASLPSPPGMM